MLNYTIQSKNYEFQLALQNKQSKKEQGQYYTPKDVAVVMSKWFQNLEGENICDVSCGTGNLILSYFEVIGKEKTIEIIKNKQVFLYDIDKQALDICKNTILELYGKDLEDYLNILCCDFLDKNVKLPENCKVISNPPYAKMKEIKQNWNKTNIIEDTMEYYSAFIEKIINQSKSSVIISPYSFLSGNKFYSLRKELNKHNGFFVSFDNVPANIFGKKYDIFNSNKSNSVRATISVIENKAQQKGFRTTPLIRFKNEERDKLLNCEVLENQLGNDYQIINDNNELSKMYCKCEKSLEYVWWKWRQNSNKQIKDLICKNNFFDNQKYTIYFPNTCRYNTTCSCYNLQRSGKYQFSFDDIDEFNYCYCLFNSSFCYWFWRMYDGGITYQKGLLEIMPVFFDILTKEDKQFFKQTAEEMIKQEKQFITTKNNVGIQENIKFPVEYRRQINQKLLDILQIDKNENCFDVLHRNRFFNL